ncbi:MAG: hypothetical protein HN580_05910 [Deltaproteobacteria bacterium]|nr:hypothetical protein [Deltaproteobacteria bacterium]MBT4264290.1 hypothetical protein [Deltaproteobacteria bacterium]MBT6501186.1 hypothetical protein [Deltaproteobacteria bacterium]MBT7155427.1 hypothetical protein [Deltaproteobacteria bacterium]MBT7888533.1 hypothetical protein [Deltaproteobacteria bacterium]
MSQSDKVPAKEDLVSFFLPHLTRHVGSLVTALSQHQKKDLSDAEWQIILNEKQAGKFLNHHYLKESWEEIERFLKQEVKLFYFLDEKQQGLVAQSFTIWVFFSPAIAAEYFNSLSEKPKNFSAQSIQPLPFPNLLDVFSTGFSEIISQDNLNNWLKIEKAVEFIQISDFFLQKDDISELSKTVRRKITKYLSPEIQQLQEDIFSAISSPTILERRLQGVLKICWRYFRAKNELESKYYRKLLTDKPEERIKGLKLAKKKLIDFELDMAE